LAETESQHYIKEQDLSLTDHAATHQVLIVEQVYYIYNWIVSFFSL